MIILIAALLIVIAILSFLIILYIREVRHLHQQLDQLEAGSHMELTSHTRNRGFLRIYTKLNHIFDMVKSDELKYSRAQTELKQTVSHIAHDIRTPLTSASGYLQMLMDCTQSEKQLRYEQIIEKRIGELKDMLEELFLYTKLTSEEFSLDCVRTEVFPILSDCMIGLYHVFEEKQIEPDIRFEDEDICVLASPEIMGRIFRNLINNALLHGTGGLCIVQKGTAFTFTNPIEDASVIDTERLFDRFYKADPARQKRSSGLGLAIVKELCERIGGTADAVVVDGHFLAVTVSFRPAVKEGQNVRER